MEAFEKKEGQHALSRIYQKQWAYGEKGKEQICIWKISKGGFILEYPFISKYTVRFGEFFLPDWFGKEKRAYENLCCKIEGEYQRIINTITNQKQLIDRHEDLLKHFVALTISRSSQLRETISFFIGSKLWKLGL